MPTIKSVAAQIATLMRQHEAAVKAEAVARIAINMLKEQLSLAKSQLTEALKENKALKAENRRLQRELSAIQAMLATPEEAPAKVRKPRQRKAIAPPVTIVEEVSEEEANRDIFDE